MTMHSVVISVEETFSDVIFPCRVMEFEISLKQLVEMSLLAMLKVIFDDILLKKHPISFEMSSVRQFPCKSTVTRLLSIYKQC